MCKKRYCISASAFDRKGRLICTRNNSYTKSHPLQKHFAKLAGEPFKEYLHSELACLIAARDVKVHRLVVVRYDYYGNFKMAMPCKTCREAIRAFGVGEIYYSTENGIILMEGY